MNCQPASEHNGKNHGPNAEQQPMETLDYLRLASFIRYLHSYNQDTSTLKRPAEIAL